MKLKILSAQEPQFTQYGRLIDGYDLAGLIGGIKNTPLPEQGVVYKAGEPELEKDPAYALLTDCFFGGMPIQIGYCNGYNSKLNCVEYHRSSEVVVAATDAVLLLAQRSEIENYNLDTSKVRAFLVRAGNAVELYASTLHYAPCSAAPGAPFQCAIVLPKGTNTEMPVFTPNNFEDKIMTAKNKWLLAHAETDEAKAGCVIGLSGVNIDIFQN